jgi:hypothetical protein
MEGDLGGFQVGVSVKERDTSVTKFDTNWSLLGWLPRQIRVAPPLLKLSGNNPIKYAPRKNVSYESAAG